MWSHCWLPPSKVRWKNTANFSFFLLWLSWQVTGRGFYGNEGGTTANSWVENLFSRKEREQWCISTSMMWVFLSFALHLPWWSGCVRLHRSKIPVELSKMLTFSWSRNVWLCPLLLFWKVMLLKYFFSIAFCCFFHKLVHYKIRLEKTTQWALPNLYEDEIWARQIELFIVVI